MTPSKCSFRIQAAVLLFLAELKATHYFQSRWLLPTKLYKTVCFSFDFFSPFQQTLHPFHIYH